MVIDVLSRYAKSEIENLILIYTIYNTVWASEINDSSNIKKNCR